MKSSITSLHTAKYGNSSKDRYKTREINVQRNELELKSSFGNIPSSSRQQPSLFSEFNASDISKAALLSSNASTPKVTNGSHIHSSLTPSQQTLAKHGMLRGSSKDRQQFLFIDNKKDVHTNTTGASQILADAAKRPSLSKFNIASSAALTRKLDSYVEAQEIKKNRSQVKTTSRSGSKENNIAQDFPIASYKSISKERTLGSYNNTPTNSAKKKAYIKTEASGSAKKNPLDLETNDYLKYSLIKGPMFGPKEKSANTSKTSLTVSRQVSPYLRTETELDSPFPMKNIQNASTKSIRPDVLLNNLIAQTVKNTNGDHRTLKMQGRSFQDQDPNKLNSSNESLTLHSKVSTSTATSKSFKGTATSKNTRTIPKSTSPIHSNNNSTTPTASMLDVENNHKRLDFSSKDKPTTYSSTSFKNMYKDKRLNYQSIMRNRQDEFEKSNINQSTANQTIKSSNSVEWNEFQRNRKNMTNIDPNSRFSTYKSVDLHKHSEVRDDSHISHDRYKSTGGVSNILTSQDSSLNTQLPQRYYSGRHFGAHDELDDAITTIHVQSSINSSKSISRSHSIAQNIKDIIDFEKRKSEALQKRISLNFENFKSAKADIDTGVSPNNKSLEKYSSNNYSDVNILGRKFPSSTKNSKSLGFDFSSHTVHPNRGSTLR